MISKQEAPAVAPKPVSDTPRTDEEARCPRTNEQRGLVFASFARQLEREVGMLTRNSFELREEITAAKADATARIDLMAKEMADMACGHARMMQERDAAMAEATTLRGTVREMEAAFSDRAKAEMEMLEETTAPLLAQILALREALENCVNIAKESSLKLSLEHPCKGAFDAIWDAEGALAATAPQVVSVEVSDKLCAALEQALRQWDNYASDIEEYLEEATHTEAQWYREYVKLAKDYREKHPKP